MKNIGFILLSFLLISCFVQTSEHERVIAENEQLRNLVAISARINIEHSILVEQNAQLKNEINGLKNEIYLKILHTVSYVMGGYENINPEIRRDMFDHILYSILVNEPYLTEIWTVWRPNALDGMDEQFIDRPGSTTTGQYASFFSRGSLSFRRETRGIILNSHPKIHTVISLIDRPNSRTDIIGTPIDKEVAGILVIGIEMSVPIISSQTNEVVGRVGGFKFLRTAK